MSKLKVRGCKYQSRMNAIILFAPVSIYMHVLIYMQLCIINFIVYTCIIVINYLCAKFR